MKKLFSKLILISCLIINCNYIYSADAENTYPASIQESSTPSKESSKNYWSSSKQSTRHFINKIQNSYSNKTTSLKSKISASKNKKSDSAQYTTDSVQNIIPDMKRNKSKKTKNNNTNKTNNTISNLKSHFNLKTTKTKKETENNENIQNITPIQDKKQEQTSKPKQNLKQSIKSVFDKKSKKNKSGKLHFDKHSLTDINESRNIKSIKKHINDEDYFKHDVKNKIYLDRFKTFGAEEEKSTFYKQKNIFEDENGDIQLRLGHGKTVDTLMEEIEQSNPDEPDSKPVELTLKDSIAIAIAKHPDILSAKLDTEIYKDRIIQEWSAYFPTFSAGINWGHDYTKYHGYHEGYGYNSVYIPDVSAGMLLYDFGKTKASVDMAKTDYDASRYDLQDAISIIIYSIKSAYYNVLFAEKQIEIYNKTIEDFDLQLASARKYFSIGKKPQIDVLTAEYNAGNAKLNLVKANNTLENAKVAFANTLGLPEFANFNLSDGLPYHEYEIDLEELLQDAFNIRPDLLSYEKIVESNYLAVRKARRYFTPDLNANGRLAYSDIDDSNTSNYRINIDLSYSVNLLQLKKQYDLAQKTYKKSLADYDAKRQTVYLEVKQAFIDFNNTKQSVKQADLNVQQAKAQHYHATGRYKAGFGDAIEIKDAENTYLNAQLAYYQALLDYNLALAELERVVGRPIESNEIENETENDNSAESNNNTNNNENNTTPVEL